MKYAVIADIHANLPALKAVMADSEVQGCNAVVCLGDLVGYYNYPNECVELVRKSGMPCVKGNYDKYCSEENDLKHFSATAAEAVKWTRAQLSANDREWLQNLKHVEIVDGFTIVHALLDSPERWGYLFSKIDAAASFPHQNTPVCFFGHTHVPLAFAQDTAASVPVIKGGTYSKFKVEPAKKYSINPGSVGQPRDNNPKAAYVIYDMDKSVIELRRLDYDRTQLKACGGDAPSPSTPVPTPRPPISDGGHNRNNLN